MRWVLWVLWVCAPVAMSLARWYSVGRLNVETVVSNTNTSSSTEEGSGFGLAMLDFLVQLPTRAVVPQVLSISLGSLSAYSCDLLCTEAVKMGHTLKECQAFMQNQRQVCMYMSQQQVDRINTAFKLLALRGVTVFGSSGDGGSHWSFQPFPGGSSIGHDLNTIGCKFQFPVFPTGSPCVCTSRATPLAARVHLTRHVFGRACAPTPHCLWGRKR